MADPFLGEIRAVSFGVIPNGWAICDGKSLPISQNQALYSLLWIQYGGGSTNFNLPDLRGRVMVGFGYLGYSTYTQGNTGGVPTVSLSLTQIPSHTHDVQVAPDTGTTNLPANNYLATVPNSGASPYVTAPTQSSQQAVMNAGMIGSSGSSAAHSNMQPYTAINYIIALSGTYPSRQ
ncbi:MAG: tail fiber protein [Nitrospirae bacterium]|nr:tail fiber protein [Magnetococcales bacterium]HAT50965.1 phage tail protein [Alphaproteobacteria bacterium]